MTANCLHRKPSGWVRLLPPHAPPRFGVSTSLRAARRALRALLPSHPVTSAQSTCSGKAGGHAGAAVRRHPSAPGGRAGQPPDKKSVVDKGDANQLTVRKLPVMRATPPRPPGWTGACSSRTKEQKSMRGAGLRCPPFGRLGDVNDGRPRSRPSAGESRSADVPGAKAKRPAP